MNIIINHHCRGFITGTDAIGQLEGKLTIGCGLTRLNPNFPGYAFNYGLAVLKNAGQAFANPDYISALWFSGKKRIKGGYPVHLTYGESERFGHFNQEFTRKITKFALCLRQQHQEAFLSFTLDRNHLLPLIHLTISIG
jgi:hypothetical protein